MDTTFEVFENPTEEQLYYIVKNMRDVDRTELGVVYGDYIDCPNILSAMLRRKSNRLFVATADGIPVTAFGLNGNIVWSLSTKDLERFPKALYRFAKEFVSTFSPVRVWKLATYDKHIKWLKRLGATETGRTVEVSGNEIKEYEL